MDLEGSIAGIFQHEFDHLNGTLITDRAESSEHIFKGSDFPTYEYELFLSTIQLRKTRGVNYNLKITGG